MGKTNLLFKFKKVLDASWESMNQAPLLSFSYSFKDFPFEQADFQLPWDIDFFLKTIFHEFCVGISIKCRNGSGDFTSLE